MRASLVRATGSAAGTLVVFGLGTLLVTSILTNTVKAIVRLRQRKTAISCLRCDGSKTRRCAGCRGSCTLEWSPFVAPKVERLAVCPVCGGSGRQKCFNCLGTGSVQPAT